MFKTFGFQLPSVYNPAGLFVGGYAGFYGDTAVFANNFTTAAGSTNADEAGDPLGRIVRLAGTLNLTQGTDANRPTLRNPSGNIWLPEFDGTNDFMTFGAQSFGAASLFADPGQQWTTWGAFKTAVRDRTILAKAGGTDATRTYRLFVENGGGTLYLNLRGTSTNSGRVVDNDAFHVWVARWTGSVAQLWVDTDAPDTCGVGAAAEESQNITVGCRTESAPASFFNGVSLPAMIDRALSNAEVSQLLARLNAFFRGV